MNKLFKMGAIGIVIAGLLSGCGSQSGESAAAPATSPSVSGSASNAPTNHKRPNLVQMFENAGASQTDAQNLATLVQKDHIQVNWVTDQLKNKVPVSTIIDDINNGKAPKRQPGQHRGNWNNGQGGQNGQNGQNGQTSTDNGGSPSSSSNSNSGSNQ